MNFPKWYVLNEETRILVDILSTVNTAIITGEPGTGKTSFAKFYAEAISAEYLYMLCTAWTTSEDLFNKINPAAIAQTVATGNSDSDMISSGILMKAAILSHKKNIVVVIDELDKAPESVDNLLLNFLDDWTVPDFEGNLIKANSDNLTVIITSNEIRELSDPLYRRCFRFRMKYLDPKIEVRIICNSVSISKSCVSELVRFVTEVRKSIRPVSLIEMIKCCKLLSKLESPTTVAVRTILEGLICSDIPSVVVKRIKKSI